MAVDWQTLDILRTTPFHTPSREETTKVASALQRWLTHHPLLRQFVLAKRDRTSLGRPPIAESWEARAEQLSFALLVLTRHMPVVTHRDGTDDLQEYQRIGLASRMATAQTYLWRKNVDNLINSAPPPPPTVITRDLCPYPFMYFSFEAAYHIWDGRTGEELGISDFTYIEDGGLGLAIYHQRSESLVETSGELRGASCPYGRRYPDDMDGVERVAIERLLKWLAFLRSPYISAEPTRMHRQARREFQRQGLDAQEAVRPVTVVTLRREYREAMAIYESSPREWRSRWWVSGHYRQQWYPSEAKHYTIWIAPYLKGPEDKPIRERVYDIRR